jgi:hypothetical protein
VLAEGTVKARKVITETVSVATGDKSARSPDADPAADTVSNVIDLKRLAGL